MFGIKASKNERRDEGGSEDVEGSEPCEKRKEVTPSTRDFPTWPGTIPGKCVLDWDLVN